MPAVKTLNKRTLIVPAIVMVGVLVTLYLRPGSGKQIHYLNVDMPNEAIVFEKWEASISFSEKLSTYIKLPGTQVNDAYDADRDGRYIRIRGRFVHDSGHSMTVPAFAMKETPDSPWAHRLRWSPDRPGEWTVTVLFDGSSGKMPHSFVQHIEATVMAVVEEGMDGPLVMPGETGNPRYVREKRPDGSSTPTLLYGTCRAWSVRHPDPSSVWGKDELIDRKRDLLLPMRRHKMNLLNQWMAPWEYLLVHHEQAEHWEQADGTFNPEPISETEQWASHQYYDQGRAAAFDAWVELCEGTEADTTVRLLLSPLPHPLFRHAAHPWSDTNGHWSPWEHPELPKNSMNGFCTADEMDVWQFFDANPRLPLLDERSKRFDHQANFFRYLIARWGYSRAIGAWVILDEVEGIGDEEGYMPERTGFWAHPQCQRWLNDIVRLFNGRLKRAADSVEYAGDPFDHPTSAGTSSVRGDYYRGANLDWGGGDVDAQPDIMGWHWYPPAEPPIKNWHKVWNRTLAGVTSFNHTPQSNRPRLITEFGAKDRLSPQFNPSSLYPSIFHFSAWAAALSGQAGTVMDWNDGKSFGEFFHKPGGAFSKKKYPINPASSLKHIQTFMAGVNLDDGGPVNQPHSQVSAVLAPGGTVVGLADRRSTQLHGWLFSPDTRIDINLRIVGLNAGRYQLTVYDSWSGNTVSRSSVEVKGVDEPLVVNVQPYLYKLPNQRAFPLLSRRYRGHDLVFSILPAKPQ